MQKEACDVFRVAGTHVDMQISWEDQLIHERGYLLICWDTARGFALQVRLEGLEGTKGTSWELAPFTWNVICISETFLIGLDQFRITAQLKHLHMMADSDTPLIKLENLLQNIPLFLTYETRLWLNTSRTWCCPDNCLARGQTLSFNFHNWTGLPWSSAPGFTCQLWWSFSFHLCYCKLLGQCMRREMEGRWAGGAEGSERAERREIRLSPLSTTRINHWIIYLLAWSA